jgi:hypothetical protein
MTPIQHKQYLIDSIAEMNAFCAKLEIKINETNNEVTGNAICGIYSRKQESITKFKQLLKEQYNHIVD